MPRIPGPTVTALRCRVVSVNPYGNPTMAPTRTGGTCPRVLRGENTYATMMAMFEHLRDDHGINEDEAGYFEARWREQAQSRIGSRVMLTDLFTQHGIEATEDQVKALVASLERQGAPLRIGPATRYISEV
jgi:hypothetical protein